MYMSINICIDIYIYIFILAEALINIPSDRAGRLPRSPSHGWQPRRTCSAAIGGTATSEGDGGSFWGRFDWENHGGLALRNGDFMAFYGI